MGQSMVAIVEDDCTGCDLCILHCPFEALLPSRSIHPVEAIPNDPSSCWSNAASVASPALVHAQRTRCTKLVFHPTPPCHRWCFIRTDLRLKPWFVGKSAILAGLMCIHGCGMLLNTFARSTPIGWQKEMAEIVYLDSPLESEALFERLCPPVRQWFKDKFPDFTPPQKLAIPAIMDQQHLLLCSPTGSGKTLTAFLTVIDQLVRLALERKLEKKVHAIYISPIKALANDIQRNLIGPLNEITEHYLPDRAQEIRVGLRTGDTSQSDRQKMLRNPPHILITTPESLAIAITSPRFQPIVSEVEYMIIDELHSMVSTKRGVHLSLTLSLLDSLLKNPVQRIGISATMEPLETVAEYLVSSDDREARGQPTSVSIAKISGSRELDLDILITHPKFSDLSMVKVLEYNIEAIADLISAHTTTLVFANTRKMTETIVQKLRPFLGDLVAGHHGSMDKNIRLDVEKKLKYGHLRAVVTSSSLEMGIDIGSVDLVLQVGSPGDIATALQRIGRAGHHVGGIPRARFLPTSVDDLIELAALQAAIQTGDMDRLDFPQNCLDVVAQFIIGLVIINELDIDEAYEIIVNSWSYRNFEYDDFIEVLDMLEEERRIWIDWEENIFGKRGTENDLLHQHRNHRTGHLPGVQRRRLHSRETVGVLRFQLADQRCDFAGWVDVLETNIQGTRVNVTSVTGHRPTIPSWSGEARSRSREPLRRCSTSSATASWPSV